MAKKKTLTSKQIVDDVLDVLREAGRSDKGVHGALTAHQILARLSPKLRKRIIRERGLPGLGLGRKNTSTHMIARAAEKLIGTGQVESRWSDLGGMFIQIDDYMIQAGSGVVMAYCYVGDEDDEE